MYYSFEYWLEHAIEKSLRIINAFRGRKTEPPRPTQIKKVLICAYHGIGNFILYTPTIQALRDHFPMAQFDLQVGNKTGCEEVLSDAGYFRKVYDISNRASWRDWIQHIGKIRRENYDLIINEFHSNSYFLAIMVTFSGATYRVGHVRSPGWPDRYGFVYNMPVVMEEAQHERERYFLLAKALGVPPRLLQGHPFIHINEQDREAARNFLVTHGISSSDLLIGVQMGTSPNMRWKQWHPERFRDLVARFAAKHPYTSILLLGSANEAEMIKQVVADIPGRIIVAAGATGLREAAALIQRCALLVCNDSGLMHVAVAVNTPVVAIYGPTDYRRTAPIGKIHTMVRKDLPCSPCFKLEGDAQVHACSHHNCLNMIEVDEVLRAVEEKLAF